jgi:tRNA (cytidine32/uridine32-2'-O)-methyltransferase
LSNSASSSLLRLNQIRIVMVNTTLPANIGAAARAMKTMGLANLVLVAPKTFPSEDATALASAAADVLDNATIVPTLQDAIADCELVFGTSARSRTIPWPLLEARAAGALAISESAHQQVAIVFGREDRGLTNEELALCNYHLTIPVNEEYGVLNVAAAIQVICYELRMSALALAGNTSQNNADSVNMPLTDDLSMAWDEPLATQAQMEQFYPHMEKMLADINFLDPENPRMVPLRLRRLFGRIRLDRVEYNLLRGVFGRVQALSKGTWPPASLQKTQDKEATQLTTAQKNIASQDQGDSSHV